MRDLLKLALTWLACVAIQPLLAGDYTLLTLQYPPYEYQVDGKGEVQGVAVDLVQESFTRMGHKVHIKVLPWPRVLWMVEKGEADGFFTTYRLPEREVWADYCREELIPQVTSLFALKDSQISYSGQMAELSGLAIGIVAKVSYGRRFDRAVKEGVIVHLAESVDGETNFRQLFAGRVELVASNREGAHYILGKMGKLPETVELKPPLASVPSYVAFSKRRNLSTLRDQLDRVLREMKADGTWRRLQERAEH